jgi:hypothetical protein
MARLEPILARLGQARRELEGAFRQVPETAWRTPPRPGAWSAAHVAAHLLMVEEAITAGAERSLEKPPRPVPLRKRFHYPIAVVGWRWPRAKTPIPLDESLIGERAEMLARLEALRRRTLSLLRRHQDRDLAAYRWPLPFLGSLNFYDWFRLVALHERRHTKQVREIVRDIHT